MYKINDQVILYSQRIRHLLYKVFMYSYSHRNKDISTVMEEYLKK